MVCAHNCRPVQLSFPSFAELTTTRAAFPFVTVSQVIGPLELRASFSRAIDELHDNAEQERLERHGQNAASFVGRFYSERLRH